MTNRSPGGLWFRKVCKAVVSPRAGQTLSIVFLMCSGGFGDRAQAQTNTRDTDVRVTVPTDVGADLLPGRSKAQFESMADVDTFHFFEFRDVGAKSRIKFRNRTTDDAGRDYKMVHYDHGNGLALADVDGDGFVDLYLLSQLGGNMLARNLGKARFEDVTADAGVALEDRVSVTASFADYDNDGDPDLFVTSVRGGNVLFENDGSGHFEDVTERTGVGYSGHSSGATFFDFDRDGWLDLFVSNVGRYTSNETGRGGYFVGLDSAFVGHLMPERTERSLLYRNVGGEGGRRFEEVGSEVGLMDDSWTGDATFTDLDLDGFPELYVLNMQGDDHYYRNQRGRFRDETAAMFGSTPWGAMGIATLDWNNDGRTDILVTDMHSDMTDFFDDPVREKLKSTKSVRSSWSDEHLQGGDNNVYGNAFYEGSPDGPFVEISDRVGAENYWPWGASAGDLNADGWEDVVITASMNYQFRYAPSSVLLNDAGRRFVDAEFVLGVEPQAALTAPWFELDCAGPDEGHEACKGRDGGITVWGAVGSRSSAIVDLDRDGDLDLVTGEFHTAPRLLLSDLTEQTEVRSFEVVLEGVRSNRDGLGATVTVRAGDLRLTRFHNGKSGYLSQSSLPLYFGLGEATEIDSVEVLWPSGAKQVVRQDLVLGGRLVVREPSEP